MEGHNIVIRVNHVPGAAPGCDISETTTVGKVILDVTFVYDEAIAIVATVPATLTANLTIAVRELRKTFSKYGLLINWKPGKTEAIIAWRGRRQREEK